MLRRYFQPILTMRGRFHQIRYYSASRKRTGWDTAVDIALIATLFLAVGAVILAQQSVERQSIAYDLDGGIYDMGGGQLLAHVNIADRAKNMTGVHLAAAFDYEATEIGRGWPFASKVITTAPDVSITLTTLGRALETDASMAPDTALRSLIESDMKLVGLDDAVEHWRSDGDVVNNRPLAWVANWIAWWLMLLIASILLIRLMQFISALYWLGQGYRWRERSRLGRCTSCGYSMQGLEFNEKCPECGELVE